MKKIPKYTPGVSRQALLTAAVICSMVGRGEAGSVQFSTYYPAPFGIYDRLRLPPRAALGQPCDAGTFYYETGVGLRLCDEATQTWGSLGEGVWTQSGNNIYPNDTAINPALMVGIGTTTPVATLDVNGGIQSVGDGNSITHKPFASGPSTYANIQAASTGLTRLGLNDQVTPRRFDVFTGGIADYLGGPFGGKFGIADVTAGSVVRFLIDSTGNVGIGTTTPDGTLDVMKTISGLTTGLRFSNWHFPGITAGGIIDSYDDGGVVRSLVLQNNGGRVGIGTTSPEYKLDVTGDIRAQNAWLRTTGVTGWYSDSYGGGWFMSDTTWIRGYNGKSLWMGGGLVGGDGGLTIGYGGVTPPAGGAIIAGNVSIGTTSTTARLTVYGSGVSLAKAIYGYSSGSGTGIMGEGGSIGVRGLGATGVVGNAVPGGVGGSFTGQNSSTSYNLRLPARNNPSRGMYIFVTDGGGCGPFPAVEFGAPGSSSSPVGYSTSLRICGVPY